MPSSSLQPPASSLAPRVNVADRLAAIAARMPEAVAVAHPGRGDVAGVNSYATCTFRELDDDATALARELVELGVRPGHRLVLLVPPSVAFVKLVFALLRSGATTVLVDPGMGRKHLVNCIAAAEPEGFVAVSRAQAVRTVLRRRFPNARFNVTVGRRWFWGGPTLRGLLERGRTSSQELPATSADDSAAIIFTSGSTGPPKGVLYTHRMFDAQAREIQRQYDLQPGGADLACFALFGLFNSAMGVTTVFPDMDFARPASADPHKLLAAASDWRVTQAFASPAVWERLSRHCEQTGEHILTLRKVFSCGAPVRADVIRCTLDHVAAPHAEMHTPYGATEALPVSTIDAREILGETAAATAKGAGVCVGHKFDSIAWRVIRITDEPIASIEDSEELPPGEIGELIVRGDQVSPAYEISLSTPLRTGRLSDLSALLSRSNQRLPPGANAIAKITDEGAVWHRMGDVGCLDDQGRFWYHGRKAQRVETRSGPLFTSPIEGVFDTLPGVRRSALVYVPSLKHPPAQLPVMVVELSAELQRSSRGERDALVERWYAVEPRLKNLWYAREGYVELEAILFHPSLPVDVRHNAKINREALAAWAAKRLDVETQTPR